MTHSIFVSFLIYSVVTSITPGPNNVMMMTSGLNFGLRRTIPHMLGIGFGFGFMVVLVGLGVGTLLRSSDLLFEILKVVGILYLLYLAYKIAMSGKSDMSGKADRPQSFLGGAMFQWVNPKAWIMTMGAITTYTASSSTWVTFITIGIIYGLISIPCVGIWAVIGDRLQYLLNNEKLIRGFNITMGGLLFVSTIPSAISVYEKIFH